MSCSKAKLKWNDLMLILAQPRFEFKCKDTILWKVPIPANSQYSLCKSALS